MKVDAPPDLSGRIYMTDGQWAADPWKRYEMRFHDGNVWTEWVSVKGVVTSDPQSRCPHRRPGGCVHGD